MYRSHSILRLRSRLYPIVGLGIRLLFLYQGVSVYGSSGGGDDDDDGDRVLCNSGLRCCDWAEHTEITGETCVVGELVR